MCPFSSGSKHVLGECRAQGSGCSQTGMERWEEAGIPRSAAGWDRMAPHAPDTRGRAREYGSSRTRSSQTLMGRWVGAEMVRGGACGGGLAPNARCSLGAPEVAYVTPYKVQGAHVVGKVQTGAGCQMRHALAGASDASCLYDCQRSPCMSVQRIVRHAVQVRRRGGAVWRRRGGRWRRGRGARGRRRRRGGGAV